MPPKCMYFTRFILINANRIMAVTGRTVGAILDEKRVDGKEEEKIVVGKSHYCTE